jgi:hypothetical protein
MPPVVSGQAAEELLELKVDEWKTSWNAEDSYVPCCLRPQVNYVRLGVTSGESNDTR